ncbi:alpha/beta fold hydrolase [Reinekea marinisedimentorum]|uniref:Alpha-beta hydrolase superfamily lysophospholipase n=1 Tax=Reinekea marinisedimentorum TaxID=230495 RepID=A0A4R3IB80_9GAMM|nr:alpha/beta fold hydrolase [Reinekea marinisedimentorum]TCS43860.1 alpha-beta hydrolase superfamily lysophospholipase [Reinekea marinisedimentorum]
MQYLEEFLLADDGHEIPVRVWRPKRVNQILVIVHGMAEYSERYAPMADWLTEQDIAVVTLNLRGHGMDCEEQELGFFAETDGWQRVVKDIHKTLEFTREELPEAPITLLGHSMGSFLVQNYIQTHHTELNQVILCGSNRVDKPKLFVSQLLIKLLITFKGKTSTSKLVDWLSFGSFNRKFKPNRTDYDWLSRDPEQVEAYTLDPFCGFSCTLSFWNDFIGGMRAINLSLWPKQLKIHLLSGSDDPVGEFGRGVSILAEQIKKQGLNLQTFKVYPQARHELVNEINAVDIWQDIRDLVINESI